MIEEYLKNHVCNPYCRQLKLDRGIPEREVDVGESESFEEPEEPRVIREKKDLHLIE